MVPIQHSATSAEIVKARWQAAIIAGTKHKLLSEIRAADAQIDDATTLAALAAACDGKVRQLQEASGP
jgi:hypothetical protein